MQTYINRIGNNYQLIVRQNDGIDKILAVCDSYDKTWNISLRLGELFHTVSILSHKEYVTKEQ